MDLRDMPLLDRAATVVAALGRGGFAQALAGLLDGVAAYQQFIVFALDGDGGARCLHAWHRERLDQADSLSRAYVDGAFHRQDPTVCAFQGGDMGLRRVRGRDIGDAAYRRAFFDAPGLAEKVALFSGAGSETLYLNLYRAAGNGEFSGQEMDGLAKVAGLTGQFILRHRALCGDEPASAATVRRLLAVQAPALTAREAEVCALTVSGFSSEAIALRLGISRHSVVTYRRRAYARLGISSQHELFRLCLENTQTRP